MDLLIGGWDVGLLTLWQSGRALTFLSGYGTGPSTVNSFANYTGDRNIGRVIRKADGIYWLTDEEKEELRTWDKPEPEAEGGLGPG